MPWARRAPPALTRRRCSRATGRACGARCCRRALRAPRPRRAVRAPVMTGAWLARTQARFEHLGRIMRCVGCDRCKLWGTLQARGLRGKESHTRHTRTRWAVGRTTHTHTHPTMCVCVCKCMCMCMCVCPRPARSWCEGSSIRPPTPRHNPQHRRAARVGAAGRGRAISGNLVQSRGLSGNLAAGARVRDSGARAARRRRRACAGSDAAGGGGARGDARAALCVARVCAGAPLSTERATVGWREKRGDGR